MTKTLTIEYEKFEEDDITVLSVVENDTVLRMFEGEESEELFDILTNEGKV